MSKTYEIRDPIHGFITLNEWERDIINHPVFQRLHRIRELAFTDMVYPGAGHTRFEHSLGVMHVISQMFDQIKLRNESLLYSELGYTPAGLERDRTLVRLAALLHDVGHPPFSHVGEDLMPVDPGTGRPYKHENYSAAVVTYVLNDIIEGHPLNQNYKIKAQEIADFLNGSATIGRVLLWRDLLSGQLDADRADYLLRDSHHIGVNYGRYDLGRLLVSLTVAIDSETNSPIIAVDKGGMHAAEGLILARYMMFTQVYFHHTRRAYDHHAAAAIKSLLMDEQKNCDLERKDLFPPPTTKKNIETFLEWDDWKVAGRIKEGAGGEHGAILLERRHHRCVFETPEVPEPHDLEKMKRVQDALQNKMNILFISKLSDCDPGCDPATYCFIDEAKNSWYKFEKDDVRICREEEYGSTPATLSSLSNVVKELKAVNQFRIYVPYHLKKEAIKIVKSLDC
ncbi:MAG: HD domain-containing protein [Desulfofundulus sp.]